MHYEADGSVANLPPAKEASNSVMKSALAGALACAFSTAVMHPVDTLKADISPFSYILCSARFLLSSYALVGFLRDIFCVRHVCKPLLSHSQNFYQTFHKLGRVGYTEVPSLQFLDNSIG